MKGVAKFFAHLFSCLAPAYAAMFIAYFVSAGNIGFLE